MEENKERFLPILHKDQYHVSEHNKYALTPDEKVKFLEMYFKTGNITKSARSIDRAVNALRVQIEKDKAFGQDFQSIRQAIKHDLEETMLTNALKDKGYMDRITWLRTNFPQEYNPNANKAEEDRSQEAIKRLSQKLEDYQLIPKSKIVEQEKDDAVQE